MLYIGIFQNNLSNATPTNKKPCQLTSNNLTSRRWAGFPSVCLHVNFFIRKQRLKGGNIYEYHTPYVGPFERIQYYNFMLYFI